MHILAFGSYDAQAHPRVKVLMEGLRARGDTVTEVNRPLGLDTTARVAMLHSGWRLPALLWRLIRSWAGLVRAALAATREQRPDAVLVGYLGHFDVLLARRLFRRAPIVLDHLIFAADTARDRGVQGGWKQQLLATLDRAALRRADVIVVDTAEHAAMVPAELADRVVVVPVGAADEWFATAPAEVPRHRPVRAIFFGLFTPLQGSTVVGEALSYLAGRDDVEVTMVGRGQQWPEAYEAARDNRRVRWLDWIPANRLPDVVAEHDICLGIFGTGPKARNVVPNKVYQGAAAGCAIVTGETDPQRHALASAARYVPVGDASSLAKAIAELADDREALSRLRRAATTRAGAAFTPYAVVDPLHRHLTRIVT